MVLRYSLKWKQRFMQFDIKVFYPDIRSDLLNKALDWVVEEIIVHSKHSLGEPAEP